MRIEEIGNATLVNGDCREVMAAMEENSVDSIVCDPPYGLSDNTGDSVGKIVSDVVFPCLADFYAKRCCNGELPFPSDSVSLLDFVNRAIREEAGVAVPEGTVNFEGDLALGEIKIEAAGESTISIAHGVLGDGGQSDRFQIGLNFMLQPRASLNAPLGDCLRGSYRELGLGRLGVLVVISEGSQFLGLLSSLAPPGPSFIRDLIRGQHDALGKAESTTGVMTCRGTELTAMFAFDLRNRTLEILPAGSTNKEGTSCELITTECVRTGARTSGLPPEFEATQFRIIGGVANGAVNFLFHKSIVSYFKKDRKGFMGKAWDHGAPGTEFWVEALRVAKPGAHLLAFGGDRTHHRLMVAIEDAGWEIRTCIYWAYGSGWPKSLDVSKAIDKAAGVEREKVPVGAPVKRMIPGADQNSTGSWIKDNGREYQPGVEIPATDATKQWQGWGTALKPAVEIIVMARRPLSESTVAANVLKHGTGTLNIDGCRVPVDVAADASQMRTMQRGQRTDDTSGQVWGTNKNGGDTPQVVRPEGRWPATLIHDGSDEVLACFPDSKGQLAAAKIGGEAHKNGIIGAMERQPISPEPRNDTGSAARFFYCAKASKSDREEGLKPKQVKAEHIQGDLYIGGSEVRKNNHPTVKPTALMRYLCRLVTPPGGLVLDPFMGSGSTGKAALQEGFRFVGIELDEEHGYFGIACARIKAAV